MKLTLAPVVLLCAALVTAQTPQKNQTYTGCVEGNAKDGYTLKLLSTTPAKDPKAASQPTYYALALPDGSKIELATMANQRVDVVGVLAPAKAKDKSGKRMLTIKEIAIVPGGC
jgi:hypothetical protein